MRRLPVEYDPADPISAAFESARVANLLHFAQLSPDARVQWLTEMLELMHSLRQRSASSDTPYVAPDQGKSTP